MRSIAGSGYRAYVREDAGQERFRMYTSAPAGRAEPTVDVSPPPWDGSAEGYGPEATDYGLFYKRADAAMGGCGCGGRGMGYDVAPGVKVSSRAGAIISIGGVAGYIFAPKLRLSRTMGVIAGLSAGWAVTALLLTAQ